MTEIFLGQPGKDRPFSEVAFEDDLPVVAGYLRVSTDIQADEGHSLETQPIYMREACARRFPDGCHIIWVADEGLSGTLPCKRDGLKRGQYRPGLTLVTRLIEQGLVQYVCVYKCNRLCRSLRIWLEFEEDYLQKYDAEFFSATEPVDNRTIAGKFIADLLMATSSYERDQILQITRHGMQARRAEGYLVGDVSYGWEWEDYRLLAPRQRRNIRPVIEQAKIVRKIVNWFLAGRYIPWIIRQLEETGVPSPNGKPIWSYQSVLNTLLNPVHCGYVRSGDGKLVRGAHYDLRIIEESTYWAVVQRREDTSTVSTSRIRPAHGILSELGRCGICGKRIRVRDMKWHRPRYECRARSTEQKHKCYQVRIEDVDRWVCKCIRDTFASPELQALSISELRRIQDEESGGLEAAYSQAQADSKRIVEESRNWDKLYSSGAVDDATYKLYAEELARESEQLQKKIAGIVKQLERGGAKQARLESAIEILNRFDDAFEALDRDEKLGLAWSVIEELVFQPQDEHVNIHLNLICGSKYSLQLPLLGSLAKKPIRLTADALTTAYCLLQGYSIFEVAEMRNISRHQVGCYIRSIMKATRSYERSEALRRVEPMIEERRQQLLIGHIPPANELNEAEIELLRTLTDKSQQQAADKLGYDILKVERMLKRIYKKLEVTTTREVLAICLERGLVDHIMGRGKRPTNNELAYLRDIAIEKPRRQMAAERGIQQRCIKTRFSKMYRKYGVKGVDALLKLFRERGWL